MPLTNNQRVNNIQFFENSEQTRKGISWIHFFFTLHDMRRFGKKKLFSICHKQENYVSSFKNMLPVIVRVPFYYIKFHLTIFSYFCSI